MEEKKLQKKWFDYFFNIRNKYDLRVSTNKPLVVSLNTKYSLKEEKEDFFNAMEQTTKFLSSKYKCIAILGNNKISFIIEDVESFTNSMHKNVRCRVHDIASVFSQYFFEHFNNLYNKEAIFWICNCFNISKEKEKSYIKFRSKEILNSFKDYESSSIISEYKNVFLYFNGERINLNEYLNGNIVIFGNKKAKMIFLI